MDKSEIESSWADLTADEKKRKLFDNQKELLDNFLAHGAITRQQYETSLNGLITKMGILPDNNKISQ